MQHPTYLDDLEDGVYGDIEVLVSSYKDGHELAAWRRMEASNALCEIKIALWLHSDETNARLAQCP